MIDIETTDNMSGSDFEAITPQQGTINVAGHHIKIVGRSTAQIEVAFMPIAISKVLDVPEPKKKNLIYWQRLAENAFVMKREGKTIDIIHNGPLQAKATLNPTNRL